MPRNMPEVDTKTWRKEPQIACMVYVDQRIVGEVLKELRDKLEKVNLLPEEYLGTVGGIQLTDSFPYFDFLACYPVTGGSEGHYVHVDVINGRERTPIFIGKTFRGFDFAARVAAKCAELLGA